MQFHLNGFRAGDPAIRPASDSCVRADDALPSEVDVLIVGCGPAGLTLAAQLSAFPDIKTCIVERVDGPLQRGRADGVACRSMEMFNAFGFADKLLKEAYWVNETTFWKPDALEPAKIARHGRIQDVEDGLSEFPHVILNQARVHDFYLQVMRESSSRLEPYYSRQLNTLQIDAGASDDLQSFPVTATFSPSGNGARQQAETVKARFVVGCDGARSAVRESIGLSLQGDAANQAWGVMDVLMVTDFPDIRMKSLIQSASEGSIVIIPREGGYLVRLYVELAKLRVDERVADRAITAEQLIEKAGKIFHPYNIDVKEVAWWSVYEIGQRLCDRFDNVPDGQRGKQLPRVFIAGDACHTHSPKAGQGMNVSMRDAFNLGWKLQSVLHRRCKPELLNTYTAERQKVARTLIDFDREWAAIVGSQAKDGDHSSDNTQNPAGFQDYFIRHGRYTAGTAIQYERSMIIAEPDHQQLASGFDIGMRFHSAPVIRLADARPMHLGHVIEADGRWRLFVFADDNDPADHSTPMHQLFAFLSESPESPLLRYGQAPSTQRDATNDLPDSDACIDFRAIYQQHFRELELNALPALLRVKKGVYQLTDYEKVFCADSTGDGDIFDMRGVDRQQGCMVVVRPDQHVAQILPLTAFAALTAFFDQFMSHG